MQQPPSLLHIRSPQVCQENEMGTYQSHNKVHNFSIFSAAPIT